MARYPLPVNAATASTAAAAPWARPGTSWIDWVIAPIEAVPGPAWAVYLIAIVILAAADHAARWLAGELPLGEVRPIFVIDASFGPLFMASIHALNGVARGALKTIRPALLVDESAAAALGLAIERTPRMWATAAAVGGVLAGAASVVGSPTNIGLNENSPVFIWVVAMVFRATSFVGGLAFVAHALHQLAAVSRIHRDLIRVELFQLEPLYAFSRLTSWTGILPVAIVVYGVASVASTAVGAFTFSLVDVLTVGIIWLVAIASFLLPMLGLHGRIVVAKRTRLEEANAALDRAIVEVATRVGDGRFEGMKDASDGLAASTSAVATIRRISTWPWDAGTLRGFLGAIGLPVLIWTITALLGRLIPR